MMRDRDDQEIKVHLLPNLMTAGNLFCGFMAVLIIFDGHSRGGMASIEETARLYKHAILLIFGACIFDLLDGRLARIAGKESAFGREFDSIADIISFGLAPALLLMDIVLYEFGSMAELLAFIYLLCGAMRLARFNCLAAIGDDKGLKEFRGFPIPAAAGVISSLTLLMLWIGAGEREFLGKIKYILPVMMLALSFLMFSSLRYPSFKNLNWRTKRSIPALAIAILLIIFTIKTYEWMMAVWFTLYLTYGMVRPWISRRWRKEIEEDEDEDDADADERQPTPVIK